MQRSTERILTTHTGSLPRPAGPRRALLERATAARRAPTPRLRRAGARRRRRDRAEAGGGRRRRRQRRRGGQGRLLDLRHRAPDRLRRAERPARAASSTSREFPEYYAAGVAGGTATLATPGLHRRRSPTRPRRRSQADIANLKAALDGVDADRRVHDRRLARRDLRSSCENEYYPSHEAYLFAARRRDEDGVRRDPRRPASCSSSTAPTSRWAGTSQFADAALDEFRSTSQLHVEALNHAIARHPARARAPAPLLGQLRGPARPRHPARARSSTSSSTARPAAISFEGANPRHEHEWRVFEDVKLPDGKVLIPGVLDSTTNFVEHPELVAQRIVRYAGSSAART